MAVVVAVGAAACGVTPKVRRDGGWSLPPDRLMVWVAGSGWRPSMGFTLEFGKRFAQRWRSGDFTRRVYEGNSWVRLTRDAWVRGVPLRVRRQSVYGPRGVLSGLGFSPAIEGSVLDYCNGADVFDVQSHENWWTPESSVAIANPQGRGPALFGVTTAMPRMCGNELVIKDSSAEVGLVDSIDQAMAPVEKDALLVREALGPSMYVLPSTNNLALSVSDPHGLFEDTTALGLRADLVLKGRVVASARWYQGGVCPSMVGRPVLVRFGDFASTWQTNGPMTRSIESLVADGCVVKFSTDAEMALSAFECDKYWKGSFEVPLAELVK